MVWNEREIERSTVNPRYRVDLDKIVTLEDAKRVLQTMDPHIYERDPRFTELKLFLKGQYE